LARGQAGMGKKHQRIIFAVKYAYKVLNRVWTTLWALALEALRKMKVPFKVVLLCGLVVKQAV